jgi:radical SAM protein with 4Fe4S-binding SPASM domain
MRRFKKAYIEITNICNLDCSYCHNNERRSQKLSIESFEYILKQIKPFTEYIYLHVKGEPLLHPEILNFLDLAHDEGFKVNITTNGLLINKLKDDFLNKPAIRQINFSLHSFTENNKENYLEDILEFVTDALNKTQIIISLRLWNFNIDDKEAYAKNKIIFESIENKFSIENKIEESLIPGKGLKIKESLYLNTDYEFEWPTLESNYYSENGFCYALRDQVAILVDGTVVPCCLDGEGITNLGNIFNENFTQIIDSERAKAIYDGFTNHNAVEALCLKCSFKERFE